MTQRLEWVPGNHPIPLDANTSPAILVSGSLAVFAVDRETGERLHLFSVEVGEPLLPLACPDGPAWDIFAIPLETSCLQTTDDLREWEQIFAQENWLAKIGEALARFCDAGEAQRAEPGKMLHLMAGQRVAVQQGLNFVHLESGDGLLLHTPVSAGTTVALTPGLWLEAACESDWKTLETGVPTLITSTIDLAVSVFFEVLDDVKRRRESADRDRFTARQHLNWRVSQTALGTLAGITGKRRGRESSHASGDPLLDAVRAAAAVLDVSVHPARGSGRRSDAVREIAQASGLRTRTVVLAGEWWRQENGPLVTHRDDGSPVALLPCPGRYEIFDPAASTRENVTASIASHLDSFAQMLYRPLPEDVSVRNMLRYLLSSRRRDLRTVALAGAGAALLGMAAPQGIAILINQAIPDADSTMLWQVVCGVIAAAFGSALFLLTQAIALLRVQSAAFITLQTGVWDYLLKLSPVFFRGFTAGQLRLRADAVTRIHQLLTADSLRALFAGAASFLSLLLMLWYSPALALIALFCGLAIVAQTWLGARSLSRVQRQWQEMEELLSGLVLQSINAVSKLRVAGAGNRAFSNWAGEYAKKQELSLQVQTLKDRIRLFNLVTPAVGSALAFLYLLSHPIPLAAFLACNSVMMIFLAALVSASDSLSGLILVANLWQALRTILTAKAEVDGSKLHPGRLRGAVTVDNLTFRYRADGPMILDGVSIKAEPGECIALTGPSGSGKSTLLNLMLRFETPHSGAIYLDGRELSSLDITAVRRQIGVVTQDGRIMAGSLFESICCGGVNTMEEAWEAARSAGLGEDIEAMPMGMHTVVSEGGGNLSGGQRQRLLIARALLLKPSIIIFDEATSALDNRTQAIVTESLNRLKATRIIVAHRLSTIRRADRIYVIEKGRVVQHGRFEELANQPGLFARLVSRQRA
jgi:NHLM bacteriocin system ABC transporter ATP-binding protein